MEIFKNLKSIFIVEEGADKATEPGSTKTPATTNENTNNSPTAPPTVTVSEGKPEDRFIKVLYEAIKKQGKDGFDYLEFQESLESLEKLSMDEQTRYQSAFAVAKTMGATPASLIEAANYYMSVLHNEEKAFEETLKSQMQLQVGDKQSEKQKLQEKIVAQNAQIAALQKEISQHQSQLDNIDKQISDASTKIETTKNNFIASYNQLVDKITQDIEKMKQYLK
ncbi:hypothetical protein MASR1M65_10900 [Saprospiraceae bacterium]